MMLPFLIENLGLPLTIYLAGDGLYISEKTIPEWLADPTVIPVGTMFRYSIAWEVVKLFIDARSEDFVWESSAEGTVSWWTYKNDIIGSIAGEDPDSTRCPAVVLHYTPDDKVAGLRGRFVAAANAFIHNTD